jgi:hypothetical protein
LNCCRKERAMPDTAYSVSLPYATFALVLRDGIVTRAAPIAGWAVGKEEARVLRYYRRKGATVERLD